MQRTKISILIFISSIFLNSCVSSNSTSHNKNICDNKIIEEIPIEQLAGKWISTLNSETYYEEIEILDETYYTQSVIVGSSYKYNSPKEIWTVEKSQSNGIYFHFDKLHYCYLTDDICHFDEGGGRDWLFFDSCSQNVLTMRSEGKLLLLNIEDTQLSRIYSSQNDLVLKIMKPDPDSQSVYYIKVKDD